MISSLKLHVISCKSAPSKLSLRKSQAMLCTSLNAYVGADGSGHDELGLQVSLYIGLPHGIVKVQVQGALAGHAAVAIAASRLAVGQPLIRSPLVPPGLPAQTLLLHQELQTFHLTPGCAVLCLTYTITRGFAHANLALALHKWMQSWRRAAGGHRGSFGREARHASNWRGGRRRGGWGSGRTTLRLVAELGEGGGHALVVACGAQEVIEDLQDGPNIPSGTPIAVLAVWVQSA